MLRVLGRQPCRVLERLGLGLELGLGLGLGLEGLERDLVRVRVRVGFRVRVTLAAVEHAVGVGGDALLFRVVVLGGHLGG